MGQAPATGRISLRTVPRNFPGRSGTKEDQVYLCSPETAAASALTGVITDPRTLEMPYPRFEEPDGYILNTEMLIPPAPAGQQRGAGEGPQHPAAAGLEPLPESSAAGALIKVGDNISTDEIMPAGEKVLPYRSNIPEISKFVFRGSTPHTTSGPCTIGNRLLRRCRAQLWPGVEPRARRPRPAISRAQGRHRQELRPHPPAKPHQLRHPA